MGRGAGVEERVLDSAELLPELVIDIAGSRSGGLPSVHEVAELARGLTPSGRLGQRTSLLNDVLLDDAGALAQVVLLSHVLLATTGKCGASTGKTVPQLVVSRLVDTGETAPLVK